MDGTKIALDSKIKVELELLYKKYHHVELLGEDPLGLVSKELGSEDFELVSYVSASLSYGRVEQIRKSLTELWIRLAKLSIQSDGSGLQAFFVDNSWKTIKKDFQKVLKGWVHRFNNEKDMLVLLKTLHRISSEKRTLGDLYAEGVSECPTEKLVFFVDKLRSYVDKNEVDLFSWFACSPTEGSTCKRMLMWLRWMLRSDEIDPGLWSNNITFKSKGIGAHLAFIPMDTHVHRWATQRGLVTRKSPSWKSVEELTAFLRKVDPKDPARFDFSICHQGMAEYRKMAHTRSL